MLLPLINKSSGGGDTPSPTPTTSLKLYVSTQTGAIVTAEKDGTIYRGSETEISGTYEIPVSDYGEYLVKEVKGATQGATLYTLPKPSMSISDFDATINIDSPEDAEVDVSIGAHGIASFTSDGSIYTVHTPMAGTYTVTGTVEGSTIAQNVTITTQGESKDVTVGDYQFVEYIQGTGTQWIDLGVATRYRVVIDIMFTSLALGIIGSYSSSDRNYLTRYYSTRNVICYGWGGGSNYFEDTNHLPETNTRMTMEYSTISGHIYYKVNGVQQYSNSASSGSTALNVYFGTLNNNGSADANISSYKVYGLKFYTSLNDEDLLLDLKPAIRVADGVAGLYNAVNNTFLTNAGTGEFIIPT